jgi:formylglycine-generating enzyme required for sulfatase activity
MSQLTITKHPVTIHYFTEDLGGNSSLNLGGDRKLSLGDKIELDMVLIPGGTFEMGSPKHELERLDREDPQHSVTVPTFFMGRTPVTEAQWQQVAKLPQINIKLDPNLSRSTDHKNRSVTGVSWDDAVEFCARLSHRTKREYRLPSEAEWEYACRAGTTTAFHFGETISTDLANYDGKNKQYGAYGRGEKGVYRNEKISVGSFPPNQFGLYDMHGNVFEWCMDDWHSNYKDAPNDGSAWIKNAETTSGKVFRGGSWYDSPRLCRSAYRYSITRDNRGDLIGFRVICCAPSSLA